MLGPSSWQNGSGPAKACAVGAFSEQDSQKSFQDVRCSAWLAGEADFFDSLWSSLSRVESPASDFSERRAATGLTKMRKRDRLVARAYAMDGNCNTTSPAPELL